MSTVQYAFTAVFLIAVCQVIQLLRYGLRVYRTWSAWRFSIVWVTLIIAEHWLYGGYGASLAFFVAVSTLDIITHLVVKREPHERHWI